MATQLYCHITIILLHLYIVMHTLCTYMYMCVYNVYYMCMYMCMHVCMVMYIHVRMCACAFIC